MCRIKSIETAFISGTDMRILGTRLVQRAGELACNERFSEARDFSKQYAESLQSVKKR